MKHYKAKGWTTMRDSRKNYEICTISTTIKNGV